VATVSKVSANAYRIYGATAGTAVIEFKDRKSTAKVYVTVTAQSTASLNGRLLASNCFQCHGTNGTGGFERLAGNSAKEIYGDLKEFASGAEDADGIMAAHAMGFTDAELQAIANYLASVR
jgi:cytochrome c553